MVWQRVVSVLLATACLTACGTWRASEAVLQDPIPARKTLQLWSGGRAQSVHGVRVLGDSVRAVPRWRPPECDSCAVYHSRAAIDSVRVRVPVVWRTALLVGTITAAVGFAIYAGRGPWGS